MLLDVARLVAQVEDDAVLHGFVELVGVDVRSEVRRRGQRALVDAKKRRSSETDQHHAIAHDLLHGLVEHTALGTMALVNEHVDVPLGLESGGQMLGDLLHVLRDRRLAAQFLVDGRKFFRRRITGDAELVDKRRHQPVRVRVERLDEIIAAHGLVGLLSGFSESVGDLLVKFVAVGDDDDAGILLILANPLRKPHHHQRLAGSLRVPDDAAFLLLDPRLGGVQRKHLVRTHHLLHARVEHDGIMDKAEKPPRLEHLKDRTVHRVLDVGRRENALRTRLAARLFPLKPVFRRREGRAVLHALGLAARDEQLGRREETRNLAVLLVAPVLAHPLFDGDRRLLEFDDAKQDAVHVEAHIRTPMGDFAARCGNAHLFGDREDVVQRILPVHEPRLLHRLARLGRNRHGIAQHLVDFLVGVVESRFGSTMRRLLELGDDARNLRRSQLLLVGEEFLQLGGIDIAVVLVFEVAPIAIAELRAQKRDHPVLNSAFDFNDHIAFSSVCIWPLPIQKSFHFPIKI